MARNYRELTKRKGVFVPRWILIFIGILALGYLGFKIFLPPAVTIQRLDSPDGERSARLTRTSYTKDHFVVYGKDGWRWNTLFYGPPLTNDFTVDLGERIWWSADSRYLGMRLKSDWVWAYDFEKGDHVSPHQVEQMWRSEQQETEE